MVHRTHHQKLKRSAHRSAHALNQDIRGWIETWNENPQPLVWTKTADQILESITKYCTRINPSGTIRVGETLLAVAEPRHAGMNAIDTRDSSQSPAVWTEFKETVPLETIDSIVARCGLQRLDVVKLDIEGSQVDALDRAGTTISRFRPTILLEAEEARLASQGRIKEDLGNALLRSRIVVEDVCWFGWWEPLGSGQTR
jgi:FkbM family methyltransferase